MGVCGIVGISVGAGVPVSVGVLVNVGVLVDVGVLVNVGVTVVVLTTGLVVITGCAHPGIVNIVKKAKEMFKKEEIYLVMGGFHLLSYSEKETERIIRELKNLEVKKIAPSHCTGVKQIELFKRAWGKDFINSGCGATIGI